MGYFRAKSSVSWRPGECVSVRVPEGLDDVRQWRVADETEREIARGQLADAQGERVELGDLPVGWYWIGLFGASGEELGWTTAAVLAPLAEEHRAARVARGARAAATKVEFFTMVRGED